MAVEELIGTEVQHAYPAPGPWRAARLAAGMTLEDAAEKIGVRPNRLRKWERGEARPRRTRPAFLAAKAYGVTMDRLIGEPEGEKKGRAMQA